MKTWKPRASALVAVLVASALVATLSPTTASAAGTTVAVDKKVLTDLLFTAQLRIHDGGLDGVADLVLSAEFLEWRRRNPTATVEQLTDRLRSRQGALRRGLSPEDRELPEPDFAIRAVTVLLAAAPSDVAAASHIRSLVGATLGRSLSAIDTREDLANGSLHSMEWVRNKGTVETNLWGAVRRKAVADAAFGQAWNARIGTPLGLDARATLNTVKQDVALQPYVDVDALLAHADSQTEFVAEGRRQFAVANDRLLQESKQARARLAKQTATCPVSTQTACTPENQAEAEKTAEKQEKEIGAAGAAAKALGGIVGISDKEAGEKLTKAATALFSVVDSINKWATSVAGRGTLDAIFSASTAALTGNILGTIMTLVGLFGESTPSLDQQILDQVVALRKEVDALRTEMRESFQRIEQQLTAIYDAMMLEFDKLRADIAGNTVRLIEIQNNIAELGLRLEEVAATILTAIGDVELSDTRADVNKYIGYLETYGQAIPTYDEYTDPENQFHYTATQVASHTAFVVPASWANDPSVDPATVLNSYGEAKALSYLARIAHLRSSSIPDPADIISNPSVWNLGAQAYTLLQLQNPNYARQVNSSRSDEIAQKGQRILDTSSSFSAPVPPLEPGAPTTNPLFSGLLADYRTATGQLADELRRIRTDEIQTRYEPGLVVKTYDLFGGPDQEVAPPADPGTLSKCVTAASNPPLSRPTNVSYTRFAPSVKLAAYAFSPTSTPPGSGETPQLPKVRQCYEVEWTAERTVMSTNYESEFARLRATMRTQFAWGPTAAWQDGLTATYTWPEEEISRTCTTFRCNPDTNEFYKDETTVLRDRWPTTYKTQFQQSATVASNVALVDAVRAQMTQFLQGRQKALYDKEGAAIRNAGTTANTAAGRMSTAARLLQAYTRLGFPTALASDDVLSSLLFGQYQIPLNTGTDLNISTTYDVARGAYTCTEAIGTPCSGGPYDPRLDQPYLDPACDATGLPAVPGDPVGDCLVAAAFGGASTLAARYAHHSQQLADGVYVERVPWVATTMAALPVVDDVVRAGSSNW